MVLAAGLGYGAAILARLVQSVVAVEADVGLAEGARQVLRDLGVTGVQQVVGEAEQGAAAAGPYDIILIEGAVHEVPKAIADQLAEGGRLATVVADPSGALGVAHLFVKQGGVVSGRPLFDAGTPPVPGFARPARFTF
jgi:protein-L-isoaspartate(D-aspartate) O-methyltransferase